MVLKVVSATAQIAILLLAIVLMIAITKRQVFDDSMQDFQKRVDTRLEDDRRYYENKINRLQEQLDSLISTREVRVRIFNERFDNLERQVREQKTQQNFMMYNGNTNNNSGSVSKNNIPRLE